MNVHLPHHRSEGRNGHRRPTPRARRMQRGATIVEAAFALPIFLTMVMGLVDFGVGVLQTSQVSSAAADGARAALIWRSGADQPDVAGSPSHGRIREAVAGRLIGREFTFEARCVTSAGSTISCSSANAETDRIRVTVRSDFRPVSPLGNVIGRGLVIDHSATMGLVRQPENLPVTASSVPTTTTMPTTTVPSPSTTVPGPTTTVPAPTTTIPPCVVLSVSTDPSPLDITGSDSLQTAAPIAVTTSGGVCGSMTVTVNGTVVPLAGGPTYQGTIPKHTPIIAGDNSVVVTSNGTVIYSGYVRAEK